MHTNASCHDRPQGTSLDPSEPARLAAEEALTRLVAWFHDSVDESPITFLEARERGAIIVGIYCGFVPSELIWASGAVPVSLCADDQTAIAIAEEDLPRNLCPLVKSSYGLAASDRCPFFHVSSAVIGETTCDGKKKMFELMAGLKPLHVMQLPYDPTDGVSLETWSKRIVATTDFLEGVTGRRAEPEALRQEIIRRNRTSRTARELIRETFADDVIPLRWTDMLWVVSAGDFLIDRGPYEHRLEELLTAVRQAKRAGIRAYAAGSPRVLVTGTPISADLNKVMSLIEQHGGAVVSHDACSGVKPFWRPTDEEGDPFAAVARATLALPCACMSPNPGRLELLREQVSLMRVQGIVDVVLQACHTFNIESHSIKGAAAELGLPYLKIETDYSDADVGQLSVRIEAFLEMARDAATRDGRE